MPVASACSADTRLLFITRVARLFAHGFLSVVLVLYLARVGLTTAQIGLLLSLTLIGDSVISLWITTTADRYGRKKMLILGAVLMTFSGTLFAFTDHFPLLLFAATVGIISPSGYEVGPFLSIEQAALAQVCTDRQRTYVFAWYNLVGALATAFGALAAGGIVQALQRAGLSDLVSYRVLLVGYALIGVILALLFGLLSRKVEAAEDCPHQGIASSFKARFGLHRSQGVVFKLSALFALDAFAGGFVLQSVLAYWFQLRFGVEPAILGSIFFGANLVAGLSSLSAAWVASRIGLVRTMVFTHLPSQVLLILVPLMPTLPLAAAMLLLRFSISQMDIPTRQSYTMAVVTSEERSAAGGITGISRTMGASLSPLLIGPLLGGPAGGALLFFLAGGLKILYDLLLYRSFKSLKPPEELN
ncbi:MAG: MFS transporter [Syntrophobacteraceae bacterium]|nr:MFS transporter [Syntrophobacteraceae bacterium]